MAASAEEAQRMAASHPGRIDLLLTDANMPGKSGIELANALVADRPGLPVIVMSGYTEEMINVAGLTHAVVGHPDAVEMNIEVMPRLYLT